MIGLMNLPKSYLCNFGKFVKNSIRMHNTKSEQYTPIVKLAKTVLIANGMYILTFQNECQPKGNQNTPRDIKIKDSSSNNLNKSPSTLSPNNVFHSNDSRSHSSRTASVMKVQRSKNSYLSNWFDYHDSSFSGFFGQSLLKSTYYIRTYKEKSSW